MENAPTVVEHKIVNFEEFAMTGETIKKQVAIVQDVMNSVMSDGEHYGVIPGCGKKPSLLKPGAEKLSTTFRLAPSYGISRYDLPKGHREYEVMCTLTHIPTGQVVGQGVGSCSSMERKYRYRTGEVKNTGKPVPQAYWNDRDTNLIGGKGFSIKKINGKWMIVEAGEKVEHDNPADYYNTILKMAKKRAHVDAILTATAASDIFSQDLEDLKDVLTPKEPANSNDSKPEQPKKNQPKSAPESNGKRPLEGDMTDQQKNAIIKIGGKQKLSSKETEEVMTWYAKSKGLEAPDKQTASDLITGFPQILNDFLDGRQAA